MPRTVNKQDEHGIFIEQDWSVQRTRPLHEAATKHFSESFIYYFAAFEKGAK